MTLPPNSGPTADRPMLVGLLADVSASMMTSIQNRSGAGGSRLDSLRTALDDLIASAAKHCVEGVGGRVSPRLRLFAYGFGFGNPLAFLLGDGGAKVRDLLDLDNGHPSAVGIDQLARNWTTYRDHISGLVPSMFGDTPMALAFREAEQRFRVELASGSYTRPPVLFVVSDGEPTDEPAAAVRKIADRLKAAGVTIVSCLLTDEDLTEPRRLYGAAQPDWPAGARLMFDCASVLPPGSPFDAYLTENRWPVEAGGRLFTQINQSEVLAEFSKVALSPLRQPVTADPRQRPIRVFVTYSHQDARYLDQDSLLGSLAGLRSEGFEFFRPGHRHRRPVGRPDPPGDRPDRRRADTGQRGIPQLRLLPEGGDRLVPGGPEPAGHEDPAGDPVALRLAVARLARPDPGPAAQRSDPDHPLHQQGQAGPALPGHPPRPAGRRPAGPLRFTHPGLTPTRRRRSAHPGLTDPAAAGRSFAASSVVSGHPGRSRSYHEGVEWVTVRFAGGPADGTARDLPASPGGGPPRRWILSSGPDGPPGPPGVDHLYELRPGREVDGCPTMVFVRSDPVGMTE
ncbi:hypothetical protein O7626_38880 [Micromonospora sp. WMMD1102]|uniref:hypothetical protein n=1 Tax=Micromonospora sp. WMMD1102 TaxID=3016105 RepID=UPI0024155721|nr:hypothetical protein [Micromonospora sp. WMMD1102]MDG4791784.1 hypothetical protein [Micromonospora sp. WMMD1102]